MVVYGLDFEVGILTSGKEVESTGTIPRLEVDLARVVQSVLVETGFCPLIQLLSTFAGAAGNLPYLKIQYSHDTTIFRTSGLK